MMTITTAKYLAELFHEGQTRADKVTPYIEHPKKVAELVEKFGGSEFCVALAWMHDVLEESVNKVKEHFHLKRNIEHKAAFLLDMRDIWEHSFTFALCKLSDHWKNDQNSIKNGGKVAYLAELLIGSNTDIVLVKLCDMLANIMESNGSRMSQETRYYKAVQCLKLAERKDLDERHEEVITAIEAYYNIHNSKK
jgi:(p)ppGpp synthase/HD superfamily hydrolase